LKSVCQSSGKGSFNVRGTCSKSDDGDEAAIFLFYPLKEFALVFLDIYNEAGVCTCETVGGDVIVIHPGTATISSCVHRSPSEHAPQVVTLERIPLEEEPETEQLCNNGGCTNVADDDDDDDDEEEECSFDASHKQRSVYIKEEEEACDPLYDD